MERTYEVLSKRWDSSHVFCCSPKDGHVLHFSQFPFAEDEQPNWSYVDLTEYTNAPSAITTEKVVSIFASVTGSGGHFLIFKGQDNHLHTLSHRPGGNWEYQCLSEHPKVRAMSSITCLSIESVVYVNYIAEDSGHILHLIFKSAGGAIEVVDATEAANCKTNAENLTTQVLNGRDIGIFFTGEDLRLHRIKWVADSNSWQFDENIYKRPVARSKQSIFSMCCFITEQKDGHVLFVGTDSHIHEVYERKGKWIHKDLTEETEGTPDVSRHHPVACQVMEDTSTHIFFISGEEEYYTLHTVFWAEENDNWKTSQISDTCWQPASDEEEGEETCSFRTVGPVSSRLTEAGNQNARVAIMGSFRPKTSFWVFAGDAASEGSYEMTEVKEFNAKGESVDRAPVVVVEDDAAAMLNATHGLGKGKGRKAHVSESEVSTTDLNSTKLQPMYYSKKKASWVPLKKRNKAAGLEIQSLSLVTFNVLFNKVLGDLRHPALLELVHTYHPDVIAFQEADQAFLNILLNTPWVKEYYLSDTIGTTIRPYGCLLLSKIPWSHLFLHDLPTKLGRKAVLGEFHLSMHKKDVRKVVVATSHLESYPQDKPIRRLQLTTVLDHLKEADDAIFLGDFNFAEQTETVDSSYTDLWVALHPGEDGFTFNYRENDLTKATRCYDICRYDRVYLRSQGETWRAKSIDIIGKDPIQLPSDAPLPTLKGITVPQLWPSDHFGLHAVLTKT